MKFQDGMYGGSVDSLVYNLFNATRQTSLLNIYFNGILFVMPIIILTFFAINKMVETESNMAVNVLFIISFQCLIMVLLSFVSREEGIFAFLDVVTSAFMYGPIICIFDFLALLQQSLMLWFLGFFMHLVYSVVLYGSLRARLISTEHNE